MSSEDLSLENTSLPHTPVTYSVKNTLLADPDVLLMFHGLLWFTFHGPDECQIGIHNTTYGQSHRHPHELRLDIWTITGSGTAQRKREQVPLGDPKTIEGIQIDVNNPRSDATGVHVYKRDPFSRPDLNHENDPNDWRWALDFEQDLFYPGGIKLKPNTVSSVISINHGLFYTIQKTTSTFELLPGNGAPIPIGNVAQYLGGNIYLERNGGVTLTVRYPFPKPPIIKPLSWTDGTRYQIDISNDCYKNGSHCTFEKPDHPTDKKKRNDFYLYYDCFEVPSGKHEIGLKKSQSDKAPRLPDYVVYDEHEKSDDYTESNNDSPCGSVVAGRGGNS